jgi:hypothetical protein
MSLWSYSGVVETGATGPAVYIPKEIEAVVSVGLVPAGGASGKVQYTLSPPAAVEGATATWRDWPGGVVTETTDDVLVGPVTAVRAVSSSGDVTLEVVG